MILTLKTHYEYVCGAGHREKVYGHQPVMVHVEFRGQL